MVEGKVKMGSAVSDLMETCDHLSWKEVRHYLWIVESYHKSMHFGRMVQYCTSNSTVIEIFSFIYLRD